jgi:hypothetical protein
MAEETNAERMERERIEHLARDAAAKFLEEQKRKKWEQSNPPAEEEDQTQALMFAMFEALGLPMRNPDDRRRSIVRMGRLIRMQEGAFAFVKAMTVGVIAIVSTAIGAFLASLYTKGR